MLLSLGLLERTDGSSGGGAPGGGVRVYITELIYVFFFGSLAFLALFLRYLKAERTTCTIATLEPCQIVSFRSEFTAWLLECVGAKCTNFVAPFLEQK